MTVDLDTAIELDERIAVLEAELAEARAQLRRADQENAAAHMSLDRANIELAEALHQVQQTQIDRDTWRSNYHEVAEQIAAKDKKFNQQVDASNQQIKVRDAENNKLRSQIAHDRIIFKGMEAQIAAKDIRLAAWDEYAGAYFMIDDARAYMHLVRLVKRGETVSRETEG